MFVLIALLSVFPVIICHQFPQTKTRPHIVIFMADDVGIDDFSFHGNCGHLTPNVDALAYHGVILNRHYTPWLCTPSRAALLTGRNPINIGMQHNSLSNDEPWGLPSQYPTMANIFQNAGYSTALIGKWHLGSARKEWTPTYRGFDYHFGYLGGFIDYWQRRSIMLNMTQGLGYDFRRNLDLECSKLGTYVTDLLTNEAERVIMHHDRKQPLFLMVNHLAGHTANEEPLQAPQEEIDKFKYIQDSRKRIYAAMISKLDESLGRIVGALGERRMLENSIILFYSDNGAPSEGTFANTGSNWPLRGQKFTPWEGGVRVAAAIWSPLLLRRSEIWHQNIHVTDWLSTLATAAGICLSPRLQLDGIDLWQELSSGNANPMHNGRRIVHGMDNRVPAISYMRGVWKYINGTTNYTGVLTSRLKNETDPRNQQYSRTILQSQASKILQGFDYYPLDDLKIGELRKQAEIKCNPELSRNLTCDKLSSECLFRIDIDPCEQENLASLPAYYSILDAMRRDVDWYKLNSMPPEYKSPTSQSNPKSHHCTWTMFLEEPISEMVECGNFGLPCHETQII